MLSWFKDISEFWVFGRGLDKKKSNPLDNQFDYETLQLSFLLF